MEKTCTTCKTTKPLDDFYYYKTRGRYYSKCKSCLSEDKKRRYESSMSGDRASEYREESSKRSETKQLLGKGLRKCIKCNEIKEISNFQYRKNHKSYDTRCKKCVNTIKSSKEMANRRASETAEQREIRLYNDRQVALRKHGKSMCKKCQNIKDITEFDKREHGRVDSHCKVCRRPQKVQAQRRRRGRFSAMPKQWHIDRKAVIWADTNGAKVCTSCGDTKSLDDFYYIKSSGSYRSECKRCELDRQYRYEKTHKRRGNRRIYRARYNDKAQGQSVAHAALNKAVSNGELERPHRCDRCGDTTRVVGHHEDYSKPLDVTWLCEPCHKAVHAIKNGSVNF